jgi:hypothetical protein
LPTHDAGGARPGTRSGLNRPSHSADTTKSMGLHRLCAWALLGLGVVLGSCSGPPRFTTKGTTGQGDHIETPGPGVDKGRFREFSEDLVGTRYRFGGQGTGGFDCSGLVGHVYREYNGMKLPRTVRELFQIGLPVDRKRFKTGDLLFYNTDGRGPSHVGIFLWNSTFLHASSSEGVVLTDTRDAYYARRYLGARRLLEP